MVGSDEKDWAITYYLLQADNSLNITLIEMEPTYARASTTLAEGNICVQCNIKENIEMSLYGLQVLQDFSEQMAVGDVKPEVDFRRHGNLFIVDAVSRAEAERGYALQRSLGCEVEWLSPEQVQQRYPFYNLEAA